MVLVSQQQLLHFLSFPRDQTESRLSISSSSLTSTSAWHGSGLSWCHPWKVIMAQRAVNRDICMLQFKTMDKNEALIALWQRSSHGNQALLKELRVEALRFSPKQVHEHLDALKGGYGTVSIVV